jgi:hypothetical protein
MGRSGDHNVLILQYAGHSVARLPEGVWISAVVRAIKPAPLRGAGLGLAVRMTIALSLIRILKKRS